MWGAAVRAPDFRSRDQGSSPPPAVLKLGQFCLCLSEETLKALGLFHLVSLPGEIKDPTQGNGKNLCVIEQVI